MVNIRLLVLTTMSDELPWPILPPSADTDCTVIGY